MNVALHVDCIITCLPSQLRLAPRDITARPYVVVVMTGPSVFFLVFPSTRFSSVSDLNLAINHSDVTVFKQGLRINHDNDGLTAVHSVIVNVWKK